MSLAKRTRAVAEAGQSRGLVRLVVAGLGVLAIGLGVQDDLLGTTIAGALALGYTIGEMGAEPDRRYMEGFSDGLVIAPELDAADRDEAARPARRPQPDPDVRGLPGDTVEDVAARVDAAFDRPVREARGRVTIDPGTADLRAAFALADGPRQPGAPIAPDGSPIALSGPRASSFPAIPEATIVGGRSLGGIQEARPAHRRQARHARGPAREG